RFRHAVILRRDAVALGEHEAVARVVVGPLRIVPYPVEIERRQDVDHRQRSARMPGAGIRQHPQDLRASLPRNALQPRNVRRCDPSRPSMNPAISSTRTRDTAISGAYTTSSLAHTIVPLVSFVVPMTWVRTRVMLSLIRMVLALSGATRRPSRITYESPTTVQVKSPLASPLIAYVYQMRPM